MATQSPPAATSSSSPTPDALEISVFPPLPPRTAGDLDGHLQSPFRRWTPWLVPAVVAANVVMFLVTMYVNDCPRNNSRHCAGIFLGRFAFQPLKENPLLGPSSATLEKMGALYAYDITHEHQVWRLFSCVWLHAGVVHIFANMLSLLLIGIRLEQEFGFVRIGLLYLISGYGGSIMSALFIKSSISVGASGALFGLLGGMLSELLTNWTIYANKCAALLTLIIVIVINLAVGFLPHVDNFAHIGGFISGFLLGFVVLIRPQYGWVSQKKIPPGRQTRPLKHKYKTYQYVLWIAAIILLIILLAVGTVVLFKGGNAYEYCSWCSHLQCDPMSKGSCSSPATYCLTSQDGHYLNLTCGDRSTTHTFALPNATEFHIKELCTQLCS